MVLFTVSAGASSSDVSSACDNRPNGFFANNPIDCQAFWRCQNGIATSNRCPNRLHFNEAAQLCDLPENYPCRGGNDEDSEVTTQAINLDMPVNVDDIDAAYPCYDRPNGYFVNNPKNCQAYWVCMAGEAHSGQCPPQYNFNQASQNCDYPENYPCGGDHNHSGESDEDSDRPPGNHCPDSGIYAFLKEGSCEEFNFCFAGYHSIRRCANGLQFDQNSRQCNFPDVVRCARDRCPSYNDPNNIVTHVSTSRCDE